MSDDEVIVAFSKESVNLTLWKKWAMDNKEVLGANDGGAVACGQDEDLAEMERVLMQDSAP
jgi:hypothetical protein